MTIDEHNVQNLTQQINGTKTHETYNEFNKIDNAHRPNDATQNLKAHTDQRINIDTSNEQFKPIRFLELAMTGKKKLPLHKLIHPCTNRI